MDHNATGSDPFAETLDSPAPTPQPAAAPQRAGMGLVEGSCPHMTGETCDLLRRRLRAAALLLFAGFAAFLVLRLVQGATAADQGQPYLLGTQVIVTAVLGLISAMLCTRCKGALRMLRTRELIVFGLPAGFFLLLQAEWIQTSAAKGFLPNIGGPWVFLMFTYALFIPNTWRRAGAVLGVMAAAPVAMMAALWMTHDQCADCMTADAMYVPQTSLLLLISAIGATFGVHTIGTLRREAFRARQLGQYYLKEQIGAGGMGEVYLAEHQLLKRPCAIKLIRPEKAGDPQVLARFEREVQATAKLSHWNTIDIFDYGIADDGTFYYVMEYLPGLSLDRLVEQNGPLPAERVVHLLRQVCEALREAHEAGLIHRDIKPGNIFAAERGGVYDVAKLLDFGLAKPLMKVDSLQLTQDGGITGSPLYMSPEQVIGDHPPDERSDIYALGCVAYYLLTGRPPFEREQAIKVLLAHANAPVTPPRELVADIPADLEDVVLRCLAKAPEDRYQDVASLAAALAACDSADRWLRDEAARWWKNHARGELAEPVVIGG
ncbi:MAG: serine/threonine protein kinase [Planctomycetes bacterium]|nr:serine/threonine protein kinase [Planctomycetota bacterium]